MSKRQISYFITKENWKPLQLNDALEFKTIVIEAFYRIAGDRINILQQSLTDLVQSTNNETKSSAGDKYETGRAMLQIEQDKVRKQILSAKEQKQLFERVIKQLRSTTIAAGSLVKTNRGYFFLSIALGKIKVNDITIISVSPQSPLGSKLLGLKINESATVNGIHYIIEEIE